MENKQALKLIEKIQKEIMQNKFVAADAVSDLKKVREITLELNNPVVTKALRLAYEHLETNDAFLIGIPDDEPVVVSGREGRDGFGQLLEVVVDLGPNGGDVGRGLQENLQELGGHLLQERRAVASDRLQPLAIQHKPRFNMLSRRT